MMSISEKLKQARLLANLTQEELAEKIGVSRQTISNWENARSYPDIVSIVTLSNAYDISLDSLLKGDDYMLKHLKDSTDIVRSNKRLTVWLVIVAIIYIPLVLFFVHAGVTHTISPDNRLMHALVGFVVGLGIALPFKALYKLNKQTKSEIE